MTKMALEKNLIFYHTHTSTHKKIYTGVASAVANREGAENEHSCRPKARSTYVHTQAHTHTHTHTETRRRDTKCFNGEKTLHLCKQLHSLCLSLSLSYDVRILKFFVFPFVSHCRSLQRHKHIHSRIHKGI